MTYETRTMSLLVIPEGEPSFSEQGTEVRIVDEAGGEYVEVEQSGHASLGKIQINPEEWPALREAIDRMIGMCRNPKGID